ncbi:MAG: hypothetical protein HY898_04965 [Deltaproteobacteria bacterium]|nr:hypothetical protein [Deltaproteobacteria bacterium]
MACGVSRLGALILALLALASCGDSSSGEPPSAPAAIGVVLVVHGGFPRYSDQNLWDSAVQMFAYDPNHSVYKMAIWKPENWGMVLGAGSVAKSRAKYPFEYEKLGGVDPFDSIVAKQRADLQNALSAIASERGTTIEVEIASWISAKGDVSSWPYPRFIYQSPNDATVHCNYCGEQEPEGAWQGCDPERYDVDGPFERLASKGATRILMIDLTVGGARFSKSFDVYRMGKKALQDWSRRTGKAATLTWLNDPTDLMERSYPSAPAGWTSTAGPADKDESIDLAAAPNPVVADAALAASNAEAIAAALSPVVADDKTGVLLLNHAITPNNQVFDPKIDDTVALEVAIRAELVKRRPGLNPSLVVGAFMGVKELNPDNGLVELSRAMRGEDLGHAYLYETDRKLPDLPWGYRYWDALQFLIDQGVEHIVVGFPQIVADSVLNLIEVPNQIGKEIGIRSWRSYGGDASAWPKDGTPFAPYWGIWATTGCGTVPCCFHMAGCGAQGGYPPPRQTPADVAMYDADPSLAFELGAWGHLGYDPAKGPPDESSPVQGQYRGTWAMYRAPNNDARLIELLARQVEAALAR